MGEAVQTYALVDLAAAPALLSLVLAAVERGAAHPLFEGPIEPMVARVSPYIVDPARAGGLLDHWRIHGRRCPWGILIETPLPPASARRHVRRFLQVRLPDGTGPVLMRLWDPRVLGPFLRHLDPAQHARVFAQPIAFCWEENGRWHRCTANGIHALADAMPGTQAA